VITLSTSALVVQPFGTVMPTQRSAATRVPEKEPKPKSLKRKRTSPPPPAKKKGKKGDTAYGVSRGVDFVDVACVLNFDLPTSARAYTHRVGRTARAGRSGMALSFIVPADEFGKNRVVGNVESTKRDEKVFARIESEQGARGSKIVAYKFDMNQVNSFRYRMEDALRSVTRAAVKEARVKELKAEILNSDRLKAHFEDNPLDLEYLRHDKALHPTRVQPHMKHVPKYLMPRIAPVPGSVAEDEVGAVPFRKDAGSSRGRGRGRGGKSSRGGSAGGRKKKSDPLKKFGR
jgi:ATP-dependent RNA helicase DDX56/DBP9